MMTDKEATVGNSSKVGGSIRIDLWNTKGILDEDGDERVYWNATLSIPTEIWAYYYDKFKTKEVFNISELCNNCDGMVVIKAMDRIKKSKTGTCFLNGIGSLKYNMECNT